MIISALKVSAYIVVFAAASFVLNLPGVMFPRLDLHGGGQALLIGFALMCGFAIPKQWTAIVAGIALGSGLAVRIGAWIWPIRDPIAVPLLPYAVVLNIVVSGVIGGASTYVGQRLRRILGDYYVRTAVITAVSLLVLSVALLAMTRSVVNRHIKANELAAIQSLKALHSAAIRCGFDTVESNAAANWNCLEQMYSGPPFSATSWHRMNENAVFERGYYFILYCRPDGRPGFVVQAAPVEREQTGNREFCIDRSGEIRCPQFTGTWRKACTACGS